MNERLDLKQTQAWAWAYMTIRRPDFIIGTADNPQLERWYLAPRNAVFGNCYLHRFLKSDEDRALYDHPWDNRSWILIGEYLKHLADGSTVTRREDDMVERKATDAHRVELVTGAAITLFFTGPVIREWGFLCPQGWRPWQEFVAEFPGGNGIG